MTGRDERPFENGAAPPARRPGPEGVVVAGLGLDLLAVARIERAVGAWGEAFLQRVFTDREIGQCGAGRGRYESLAARFCGKEAVFKALGVGRPLLGWREVEIVRTASGRPEVVLTGRALDLARRAGVVRVLVSLTHTAGFAAAQALAVEKTPAVSRRIRRSMRSSN